ncbi:hypothetical protein LFL96_36980 (plasmid) [Paraburkholderia sp. D15]|uniref:DUF6998 domain-containing protein n=1 Tax=Paraburkholderia sp. D15 TaxID=2880218 RepID=UPI002478ED69|nr:hypothetical protein [Paraburkholderia sp. D15]WGS55074.1 hypothetical protein LFL96_36980 [Paraburkholderia sp. D15]
MRAAPLTFQLPAAVKALWDSQQALARHYAHTGLKFTLDGRLVGDIAEALALDHFDLVWPEKRTGGVDLLTKQEKTVQVKATGKLKTGPAFTPGRGRADYLLFFAIDFEKNTAAVIYNGPEARVRELLPAQGWTGTHVLRLASMIELARGVASCDQIPPLHDGRDRSVA